METSNSKLFGFKRSGGGNTVIYLSNLYYDPIEDISAEIGFDKATCVIRHDGKTLYTDETEMTKEDFKNKTYQPYEFYVLVVNE